MPQPKTKRRRALEIAWAAGAAICLMGALAGAARVGPLAAGQYVVLAANDLGMHCMQQDFQDFLILPPYNNVHAQVIDRSGEHPVIIDENVTVELAIPGNTRSSDKTNFWTYDQDLLGVDLPPDVGLTGVGMAGQLEPTPAHDWKIEGIPITPIDDDGRENPYPLATITVRQGGQILAQTQAVVPVSWEINCNLCHVADDKSTAELILAAHDTNQGTDLLNSRPVFCAGCHADPALGAPGQPGVSTFSSAMHTKHAPYENMVDLDNYCYSCHPGIRTQCQRDVHLANGTTCNDCHGGMEAVGDPARTPWVDEPRCGDCHSRPGFDFEQPGTLYRNSRGHGGVQCYACHGSPHAITPTVTEVDNLQALNLQGHPGKIDSCVVCHSQDEGDPFFHKMDD